MEDVVKGQYEAYPYPARRSDQQDDLDSFGPLEELEVLNHFVWGGARAWTTPLHLGKLLKAGPKPLVLTTSASIPARF